MCVSHPLLDSVIGMLGSFTDNPQSIGRVVEVRRIRVEVAEVVDLEGEADSTISQLST